jgi:hypothetical protein
MTTAASRCLWDAVAPLALLQFPWRFLVFAAFGASLAAGFAIDGWVPAESARARVAAAGLALLCALLAYAPYAQPRFALYDRAQGEIVPAPYAEALARLRDPARYQDLAERATLATLVATGQSGASGHEYAPAVVSRRPTGPPDAKAELLADGRIERSETLGPNRERFTLDVRAPDELRFHQFFFPGWRATLDGVEAPLRVEPASGLILLALPTGAHTVEIEFGSTPLRRAAGLVSLLALAALPLATAACKRSAQRAAGERSSSGRTPSEVDEARRTSRQSNRP